MLSHIKHTVKHSAIYSIGNMANKLVGFILLPLYARHLTISEYGMWGLLEATSQIVVMIGGLRLPTAMMRWLADYKDQNDQKSIVTTALLSTLLIIAVLCTFGYSERYAISKLLLDSVEHVFYIKLLFLMILFRIYNQISMQLMRFYEKSALYVTFSLIRLSVTFTVTLLAILRFNMTIDGVLYGQIAGLAVMSILTIPYILKNINFQIHSNFIKNMIPYSFPLIFASSSAMLLNVGDRFILKYFTEFSDVGQYSLAYKIASIINVFIIQSFQLSYLPIAFKMCNKHESKRFFSKVFLYYELLLIFSVLVLSVFSKDVIYLIADNPNYTHAYLLVPVISSMFIFKGMQYIFSIGLHCAKKNNYNIIAVTTGAVLNIILNILFIPVGGKTAAAITSVFSVMVVALVYYHYSQKHYPVPYEINKFFKMLFTAIILYGISLLPIATSLWVIFPYKILLVILFPVLLYPLNFYEPIEILRIRQTWSKWRNPLTWVNNIKKSGKE
jgi:O-antigen/teichoic acid export membrane protein